MDSLFDFLDKRSMRVLVALLCLSFVGMGLLFWAIVIFDNLLFGLIGAVGIVGLGVAAFFIGLVASEKESANQARSRL